MGITAITDAAMYQPLEVGRPESKQGELTTDDFLRLMIEELTHQDPTNPMTNQEMLAQINDIANMESLKKLDASMSAMTLQQQVTTGGALIGRVVSGISTTGANVAGEVVRVISSSTGGVSLVTDGGDVIPIAMLTGIAAAEDETNG